MFNVKTRHTVKNREWILRYGKHTVRKDYHIHIANLSMERALAFSEQELYRYSNLAQYMLQTTQIIQEYIQLWTLYDQKCDSGNIKKQWNNESK